MAQRFKMSDSLHPIFYGFFVHNISGAEFYLKTVSFLNHFLENLYLNGPHNLGMNLSQLLLPDYLKLRYLLLQLSQLQQHAVNVCALGKLDFIV